VLYRLAYRAALDALVGHGLRRRLGESREAFARRASISLPAFQTLTDWHLSAAPGYAFDASLAMAGAGTGTHEASTGISRQQWTGQLNVLRRQIKARQRWWQRALASVHPLPWLLSR
jgi:protein-glutamine gamma-glutamyltransferase